MLFDILIAAFLAFITSYLYKLRKIYRKLRLKSIKHWQELVKNYGKFVANCDRELLQITVPLLQNTEKSYYDLPQKFIANYGSSNFPEIFDNYYKLF